MSDGTTEDTMKKLRLFAAGDLHGDTILAKRLAQKAADQNADLVVLCGDLTNFSQSTENLIGPFRAKDLKVALMAGNHETVDTAEFLAQQYGAKHLHGYGIKYKDVGIFGAGGANIGLAQFSEAELFELLKKGHSSIDYLGKKIMVTHVHPAGSKMENFTQFFPGSTGIRKAIDLFKPDIALCSHVHEAHGIEEMVGNTRLINVGREGKLIEL